MAIEGVKPSQLDETTARALLSALYSEWQIFKGLLYTDGNTGLNPVIKPLNFKDTNFLSGLSVSRVDLGHMQLSTDHKFTEGLTMVYIPKTGYFSNVSFNMVSDSVIDIYHYSESGIIIDNVASIYALSDVIVQGMPVEIWVRKRPQTKMNISAIATNSAGTKLVVTVDKEYNQNFPPQFYAFTLSGGKTATGLTATSATTFEINIDTPYAHGNVITLSYDLEMTSFGSGLFESLDFELMESFTNHAVTNNVP